VELSARIAELEVLKSGGKISQEEFDALVLLALHQKNQSIEPSERKALGGSESNTDLSSSKFSAKKGLIAAAVIVLLIFAFNSTRQGDPMESQQVKRLLQQKSELLATKTALENKLQEIDNYTQDILLWKLRIKDLKELGITE
jgi:hypothetical protein